MIDLTNYKLIHSDKVYKALAITWIDFKNESEHANLIFDKPRMMEVVVINEDGNVMSIRDESWCFQFLPIVNKSE